MAIYINALGIINALGENRQAIAQALFDTTDPLALSSGQTPLFSGRNTVTGTVSADLPELPQALSACQSRNNALLMAAYEQIAATVEQYKSAFRAARIGIVLGTSTSGILEAETAWKTRLDESGFPRNFHYAQQDIHSGAEFLRQYSGAGGPCYTMSTACSSSGKAIAAAGRLLEADLCDAVICGGADSLCQLTLNGFDALELVAPTRCNPFSANRNGLNIGEGAALFVLSRQADNVRLAGWGESSDGYHISAPDPSGKGPAQAIEQALAHAQLARTAISYINLHGTATPRNDAMESRLIAEHFPHQPWCSSTKPLTGHTLGAASAIELGLCWLMLNRYYNPEYQLLRHYWDGVPDPELPAVKLASQRTCRRTNVIMSNSFAFGGSNISLVLTTASHDHDSAS